MKVNEVYKRKVNGKERWKQEKKEEVMGAARKGKKEIVGEERMKCPSQIFVGLLWVVS